MSKRDFERKQREEQEATAFVFQEFIETFQDHAGPPNKLFVKSATLYAKDNGEAEKGKIYNPKPFLLKHQGHQETLKKAIECATLIREPKPERNPKAKPKSNLEQLKEELRQRHLERDERLKSRNEGAANLNPNLKIKDVFESDDSTTTNLFVANINTNMTEQDLMKIFGVFGPLASVKIMWPRSEERGKTNVGFVAFMSRKDGERALESLKAREDMRIGWAKPVELPQHPVYIPPELLKMLLPPPQSGLPFNAQIKSNTELAKKGNFDDDLLKNTYVVVTIPLDKKVLGIIHRTVEFVVKEGPLFEAMIMNKEINNTLYQFLFDNKSPNHVYYRWKLYSILNGESVYEWSTKEFRMFKNGSIWVPPLPPNYSLGMPENLIQKSEKSDRKTLSQAQRNRLINYVQNLNGNRIKIGEAMVFCLNHEAAARDVCLVVAESFENASTNPLKKVARLYLVSDVLYNSSSRRGGGGGRVCYANEFETVLGRVFGALEKTVDGLKLERDRDSLRVRIRKVLNSWDTYKIYPTDTLRRFENFFNNTTISSKFLLDTSNALEINEDSGTDEPLDGRNLIRRSLQQAESDKSNSDVTILPTTTSSLSSRGNVQPNLSDFIKSRWESVSPRKIESQAVSTQQIYDLERGRKRKRRKTEKKNREEEREYLRRLSPISEDSFSSEEDRKKEKMEGYRRRKPYGKRERKDRYHKKAK